MINNSITFPLQQLGQYIQSILAIAGLIIIRYLKKSKSFRIKNSQLIIIRDI